MLSRDVPEHDVQHETDQEPKQQKSSHEQAVQQMNNAVSAIDLNDRRDSMGPQFSHGLHDAQSQTSRFEQVFAQSQVWRVTRPIFSHEEKQCACCCAEAKVTNWVVSRVLSCFRQLRLPLLNICCRAFLQSILKAASTAVYTGLLRLCAGKAH